MTAYYNENDPYAAQWLRNLIAAEHIAPGDVDERSIVDVRADDLAAYTQCHFFAGIGGWSLALRLAGWPDNRPVWTGSCPCQPFSAAGAGKAADDERHLWPAWFSLVRECRPATIFGEQVEAAIGWGWLDAVFTDLEGEGYACGATVLPACGVGAPHIRQRLWFVADTIGNDHRRETKSTNNERDAQADRPTDRLGRRGGSLRVVADAERGASERRRYDLAGSADGPQREARQRQRLRDDARPSDEPSDLADTASGGQREFGDAPQSGRGGHADGGFSAGELGDTMRAERRSQAERRIDVEYGADARRQETASGQRMAGAIGACWRDLEWLPCTDGKARPVEPGTFPLAHGIPGRVGRLRAYGNAIVPQVAAEFIRAICTTL